MGITRERLSGVQDIQLVPAFVEITFSGPPSAGTMTVSGLRAAVRYVVKAIHLPSGDHCGTISASSGVLVRRRGLPLEPTSCTYKSRLLPSSPSQQKATCVP